MPTDSWEPVRLDECLESEFPGEWGADPTKGSNATVLRSTNIDDEGHVDLESGAPRFVAKSKLLAKVLHKGDILLEASGGGPGKPVGRVALFSGGSGEALCSNFFRTLRPDASRVDPSYLFWTLQRRYIQPSIWRFQQQTTGIINLKVADYLAAEVSLPEPGEQRLIAQILDTVDEAIRKTEKLIAKLKLVKQGLLHDLLTRGIDENGELRDPERHPEQFKDSVLGRIPAGWNVVTLSTVAAVERGKFTHRPRNDPSYYGGDYPFIQTGDIASAEGGILSGFSQTLNARGASASREFPASTIAITIAANIADTAILGIPMYFPDSVVGAIVAKPNNVRFVELCLRLAKPRLDAVAPQSAQKNINLQDLRPLRIPLPVPEEQEQIAETYEAIVGEIEAEVRSVAKLRLLKAGLMDDLLTGRVRVTPLLDPPTP